MENYNNMVANWRIMDYKDYIQKKEGRYIYIFNRLEKDNLINRIKLWIEHEDYESQKNKLKEVLKCNKYVDVVSKLFSTVDEKIIHNLIFNYSDINMLNDNYKNIMNREKQFDKELIDEYNNQFDELKSNGEFSESTMNKLKAREERNIMRSCTMNIMMKVAVMARQGEEEEQRHRQKQKRNMRH